jgi:hypothetical protein
MQKIVVFEGYKRHPKRKRKHLRGHKRHKRKSYGSAQRELFGKVAKVCLVGKGPRKAKGACMRVGMKQGLDAAKKFKAKM